MSTVLLVIHLMVAASLVGVVLLQKSEGGALGIGGGGGGGFMSGRGSANLLTRVTAGLAAAFFATSISLTILANRAAPVGSVFDRATPSAPATPGAPATPSDTSKPSEGRGGILDKLQGPAAPPVDVPLNR